MPTVKDILDKKKIAQIVATTEDATVQEAAALMNQHRIGAVVVSRGEKVVGIFSERDILCRVVAEHRDPAKTLVREVMSTPVACCQSSSKVGECRSVMTEKRIRHMPVVDGGHLVGVISSGDIMAMEHRQAQETIQYLHEYMFEGTR